MEEAKSGAMKMIISIILSLVIVSVLTMVLSYFFIIRDNRQPLNVYVDRDGKILVNGAVSTETEAARLMNDPRYEATVRYHPDSTVFYCFGQC